MIEKLTRSKSDAISNRKPGNALFYIVVLWQRLPQLMSTKHIISFQIKLAVLALLVLTLLTVLHIYEIPENIYTVTLGTPTPVWKDGQSFINITTSSYLTTTEMTPRANRYDYEDESKIAVDLSLLKQTDLNLDVLYEESKDVFDLLPNKYLPDYKSFCWYDQLGQFQCLASVYLAGMPKCGTTDLFDKLMWHPELTLQDHTDDRSLDKEFHYWTRLRVRRPVNFLMNPKIMPPKLDFSGFLAGTGAERVKHNRTLRIVDGTPSLLWDLGGWETRYPGLDEPPYSNGDLIHAVTPDAKILAILRNPIDRLYSEYLYVWRMVKMREEVRTPETFHLDVLRETRKFDRCLETKSLRNCCYSSEHSLRIRVALGVYVCYISDFLKAFGNNLLVITLDEYHSYPDVTLNKIFNHIGVHELDSEYLKSKIQSSETLNESSSVKDVVGEMLNETRQLLAKFYAPYNAMLDNLLKDSKFRFYDSVMP